MLAWAELEHASGVAAMTLSVLQTFVPNEGDGWSWVLERLARATHSDETGTEPSRELAQETSGLTRSLDTHGGPSR